MLLTSHYPSELLHLMKCTCSFQLIGDHEHAMPDLNVGSDYYCHASLEGSAPSRSPYKMYGKDHCSRQNSLLSMSSSHCFETIVDTMHFATVYT